MGAQYNKLATVVSRTGNFYVLPLFCCTLFWTCSIKRSADVHTLVIHETNTVMWKYMVLYNHWRVEIQYRQCGSNNKSHTLTQYAIKYVKVHFSISHPSVFEEDMALLIVNCFIRKTSLPLQWCCCVVGTISIIYWWQWRETLGHSSRMSCVIVSKNCSPELAAEINAEDWRRFLLVSFLRVSDIQCTGTIIRLRNLMSTLVSAQILHSVPSALSSVWNDRNSCDYVLPR